MSDVKWIKITTDIFNDDKILLIESMPDSDALIVIWFKLLCLAGQQNNSGVFLLNGRIPYTEEMFATIFRRPLNTVRMALATFEQFDMIEIINNTVTIPNWGKYQKLDQLERNREYMKNYMRKRREEQRLLAEGEGDKANCKTNSKSNVSRADKIREDKNIYDDEDARAREEKSAAENPNAYGDDDCRPEAGTIQQYAINNLKYMGMRALQEFDTFVDDLPEDVIRHGIDNALDNDKRTWSYVRAILNSYVEADVKTIQEAVDVDKRRNKKYVPAEKVQPMRKTAAQESEEFWRNVPRY